MIFSTKEIKDILAKKLPNLVQKDIDALNFYLNEDSPPYVTLLDGAITDNLGLRTIFRNVGLSGGVKKLQARINKGANPPTKLVLIVVNSSTSSDTEIGKKRLLPSMADTFSVVTDIQMHLYNTESNKE